jgi:hypothetical protein
MTSFHLVLSGRAIQTGGQLVKKTAHRHCSSWPHLADLQDVSLRLGYRSPMRREEICELGGNSVSSWSNKEMSHEISSSVTG